LTEYKIEYAHSCKEKLQKAEELCKESEILEVVRRGLEINPYAFKEHRQAPPLASIRYVKTLEHQRGGIVIPPITFYFIIKEEEKIVRVLEIDIKILDDSDLLFDADLDFLE
jgi:hypothetical protein